MAELERVVRGAYELGALAATDEAAAFYAARLAGVAEEEDGGLDVYPLDVPLDLSGRLTCDWREGDLW
jgi:aminoglycoside 2'-N-acetyltransferase I